MQVDKQAMQAKLISNKDLFFDNNLIRIITDTTGVVWSLSSGGLVRYDPVTKKAALFSSKAGLPDVPDYQGDLYLASNHKIWLGSLGYLTEFDPYSFVQNEQPPEVVLLDVESAQQMYAPQDTIGFPPGTGSVTLHFMITSYTATAQNHYYYSLGDTLHWTMAENGTLHLGGLGPGNHEVWIKGTNNAGVASNVKRVVLSIKPFWYQTGLFKTGVLLFAATLIYLLIRQRIQNIRSKSELKQKIAETEMRALRSQMNPHFIFNCLNSIGLYSAQNNSEMALYYPSKFSRLIRLTLDHSRSDLIALRQEIEMLELYLEMEKCALKINSTITSFSMKALSRTMWSCRPC